MITLNLKTGTIVLPNGFDVDLSDPENCVIKESGSVDLDKKPEYVSDTIADLKHGDVARQVRAKFGRVGNTDIVTAHSYSTVWSAFNNQGWGCSITPAGIMKYEATRTI